MFLIIHLDLIFQRKCDDHSLLCYFFLFQAKNMSFNSSFFRNVFVSFFLSKSIQISALSAPDTSHKLISDLQKEWKQKSISHWMCIYNWVLISMQKKPCDSSQWKNTFYKYNLNIYISSYHEFSYKNDTQCHMNHRNQVSRQTAILPTQF